jgi:hypothetical protein
MRRAGTLAAAALGRLRVASNQASNMPACCTPFRVASAASQCAQRGQRIAHTQHASVRLHALRLQARIAAPPALAFLRRLAFR